MKTLHSLAALAALVLTAAACSPENPPLVAPPETFSQMAVEANGFPVPYAPNVCILIVMDDSNSMDKAVNGWNRNIPTMVARITDGTTINPRIGIANVYDTSSYPASAEEVRGQGCAGETAQNRPSEFFVFDRNHKMPDGRLVRRCSPYHSDYENGELVRLSVPQSDGKQFIDGPRFVTRSTVFPGFQPQGNGNSSPAYSQILSETLKLRLRAADNTQRGPIVEEYWSPVVNALTSPRVADANRGFWMNGCRLVVITVSDAADGSRISSIANPQVQARFNRSRGQPLTYRRGNQTFPNMHGDDYITASHMFEFLREFDRDFLYFMVSPKAENSACRGEHETFSSEHRHVYRHFTLDKINEFIGMDRNRVKQVDLCEDRRIAEQLAQIGQVIRESVAPLSIRLPALPEVKSDGTLDLQVYYGQDCSTPELQANRDICQLIPQGGERGWTYIDGIVRIPPNANLRNVENGKIFIPGYTGVSVRNMNNGSRRAIPVVQ